MLEYLKNSADMYTENGALAYSSSGSDCLDLFFKAGAFRNADEQTVSDAVVRAYCEDPDTAMKIIFFARDIRGGLGERRFFRIAVKTLADFAPNSVIKNIEYFSEYGRYDDLMALLGTKCEGSAVNVIKKQLNEDMAAMKAGQPVSLAAKWLPSVNTSSSDAVKAAKRLARLMGVNDRQYRQTLSALRKYIDIIENYLRERDYTFDYSKQPSGAMFKYRKAFLNNDGERYTDYLESVKKGEVKLNTATLYPYQVTREILNRGLELTNEEIDALDVTWNAFTDTANSEDNSNALVVADGSGSMYTEYNRSAAPITVALSLAIYFAERNKGEFAGHFITFSRSPKLVEIKGRNIFEKTLYCAKYGEIANTNLEAVFELILATAVRSKLPQKELPERLYIISDMEFDYCVEGGNDDTLFDTERKKYEKYGYKLPDVIFWNVNSRSGCIPVRFTQTGAALVSGASPSIYNMVKSGDMSPEKIMRDVIGSERYAKIVG